MPKKSSSSLSSPSLKMGSVVTWNLKALIAVLSLFCLGLIIYSQGGHDTMGSRFVQSLSGSSFWREADFLAEELPKEVIDYVDQKAGEVRIDERTTNIKDVKLFYRESTPGAIMPSSGQTFLLLHGAAFTSKTWQNEVKTIQTLATLGHHVIAIDLPGFGNTPGSKANKLDFIVSVIETLTPGKRPIVVSPSMSGGFSMKLLIERPDMMCGFVPVAPAGTNDYSDSVLSSVRVPTLIVVGENDVSIGQIAKTKLQNIPTASKPQIIPRGRHPCYLDDPKMWHTLLYNFARQLTC